MLQLDYGRKAVWYRRVSGQTQADNFSFRTQDRRVKEYCKSKALIIVKEFSDVGSGLTATGRRGFTAMCDYAFDNPDGVTDVVFTDLDRFTRNVAHFLEVTDRMVKAGIHLHIALDAEEYDYHSAEKWLDRVVTAQKESRRISARTKGGQRTATELGHHIGPPPWGYILEHETDEMDENGHHVICGKLVPDPDIWDYVIEFWDRAVKYGYTPLRLSQHMRAMGAPPPDGAWTDDSARRLMKNPKFKGTLFRGLRPQSRLPGPLENAPPIILDHSHVAAVSPEDWQAVNDAIASRDRSKGSPRSHSSPNPPEWTHEVRQLRNARRGLEPSYPQIRRERGFAMPAQKEDGCRRLRVQRRHPEHVASSYHGQDHPSLSHPRESPNRNRRRQRNQPVNAGKKPVHTRSHR